MGDGASDSESDKDEDEASDDGKGGTNGLNSGAGAGAGGDAGNVAANVGRATTIGRRGGTAAAGIDGGSRKPPAPKGASYLASIARSSSSRPSLGGKSKVVFF